MNEKAILKQPKCKTCKDTGEIPRPMPKTPHPCNYVNIKESERTIPCPDCQQPPAGELTKRIRYLFDLPYQIVQKEPQKLSITIGYITPLIFEACDRLDTVEAIKAELLAALEQIRDLETECCSRCEGNGRLYADGKAHYPSENADTILCGSCGGSGRILPEDAQEIAEAAIAKAQSSTSVTPERKDE